MTRQIMDWRDRRIIWSGEAETVRDALHAAHASGANLSRANLSGANLSRADLCPAVVLLASWGAVSEALCRDLMAYDASNHPDPTAFTRWATENGPCPYSDVRVQRCANFTEQRHLYVPNHPVRSAFALMVDVLREKCAASDYHDAARAKEPQP